MCISNIGNRRPFPTNGFKSRGGADASSCSSTIDASSLKAALKDTSTASRCSNKNNHIVVQHCYHDHAYDNRTDYQEDLPARGGVTVPFPLKLHDMLNAVVENGHEHIVSWQPHGRCFVVHKPKEFVELLPYYFKLSKLASFQRQLNLYGFQRLTKGNDRGGYYHELFLKNRVFLAHSIQRIKVKGTGVRARSNPDQEPDFWSMPWVQPEQNHDSSEYNPSALRAVSCGSSISSSRTSTSDSPQLFPLNFEPEDAQSVMCQSSNMSLFFSQKLPLHMEPTALSPELSLNPVSALHEDDELFGRHFFDVEKICRQQPVAVPPSPTPVLPSMLFGSFDDGDEVMTKEVDEFFEDFDFPDDIGDEIEDDQVFGALLEQMIS